MVKRVFGQSDGFARSVPYKRLPFFLMLTETRVAATPAVPRGAHPHEVRKPPKVPFRGTYLYGYSRGDVVIKTLADRLRSLPELRCARYGADEFLVLFDGDISQERKLFDEVVRLTH